jgi:uncharacterized protein YjlB
LVLGLAEETAKLKIGGYPNGSDWNLKTSLEEHPTALIEIANLPLPNTDPLFGINGPLFDYWK